MSAQAKRITELLCAADPDTSAQGMFLLDSAGLPDAVVIDALIGPALFARLATPGGQAALLSLWERLPGLAAALRCAALPDTIFAASPLVPLYQDAIPYADAVVEPVAWDAAEAQRARLGLPLPAAALIETFGMTRSPSLEAPHTALRTAHPEHWPARLRAWMRETASRAGAPEQWLAVQDDALDTVHITAFASACADRLAARAAAQDDGTFAGAAEAHRQIEERRQEGLLWAMLSDGQRRWPLSMSAMSLLDDVDEDGWFDEPAVAFWFADPEGWPGALRRWACDCAGHVLRLYESIVPGDSRPRAALAATRELLAGEGSRAAWEAACVGAAAARTEAVLAAGRPGGSWPAPRDLDAAATAARGILAAARGDALAAARACVRATEQGVVAPFIDEDDWQRLCLKERLGV